MEQEGAASDMNNKKKKQLVAVQCPRCDSMNTKFCYYNNYSLSQPRYFCKACRRYWTHGGALRNVPVGGGSRKPKRPKLNYSSEINRSPMAGVPPPPPSVIPSSVPSFLQGVGGFMSSSSPLGGIHGYSNHDAVVGVGVGVGGSNNNNLGVVSGFNNVVGSQTESQFYHQMMMMNHMNNNNNNNRGTLLNPEQDGSVWRTMITTTTTTTQRNNNDSIAASSAAGSSSSAAAAFMLNQWPSSVTG
ncbi:hypothetical protein PIB30_035102, partial [Stylosanthes scabra]|nr:hypothetical protein [Stylosanthes scabra]